MTVPTRSDALRDLAAETFDLLVIGGGITGAGVAREASLRGLRVALVEARDFASGTSSRSTRLIHGGLRYLRQGEIQLVRQSLRERELLLGTMAPHLVRPLPFLFPVYRGDPDPLWQVRLGISIYQRLGGRKAGTARLRLSPGSVLEHLPHLQPSDLQGGALYEDAQTDDARLTLAVLRDAVVRGVVALNYVRVLGFLRERGHLAGALVRDEESGRTLAVHARYILAAVGPWADALRELSGDHVPPRVRLTKGAHLVFPSDRLPIGTACVLRGPDGRLMFALPHGDASYVGTTDTDAQDPEDVEVTGEDARYILTALQRTFPDLHLGPQDVIGAWAGLRPLVREASGRSPSAVSRDYRLFTEPSGLHVVAGGKLTAFRAMAQEIVDRLFPGTGSKDVRRRSRAPLPGAAGGPVAPDAWRRLAEGTSVRPLDLQRKLGPYGDEAPNVLALYRRGEDPPALALSLARLRYAAAEEMALHLLDFYRRRTTRLLFGGEDALRHLPRHAEEMAKLLGWSPERQQAEENAVRRQYRDMFSWRDEM